MTDTGFKLVVVASGITLLAGIATLRFRHTPGLPPRPPPPAAAHGTANELLKTTLSSPAVWRTFLESDARAAGVPVPTPAQMGKRFGYRSDGGRHVLSFEAPTVAVAGLTLTLERGDGDTAVLAIHNSSASDVAYHVVAKPSIGASLCGAARPVPLNALVITKGGTERRTECVFRSDLTLLVTKVEAIELPPLAAWYVQQVSPAAIGLEPRLARAHRADVRSTCSPIVPQTVRSGLENGDLSWRDLTDFYARHRCETYQFPVYYRAFERDDERSLPALPPASR